MTVYFFADNTIRHCAYALNSSSTSPLTIAAYCMITLCGLCLIPFLLSFAKVFVKLCMKKKSQPSDAVILISEEEQQEQPNDFDNSWWCYISWLYSPVLQSFWKIVSHVKISVLFIAFVKTAKYSCFCYCGLKRVSCCIILF